MSPEEEAKLRQMSEQMADFEFEQEIASYVGERGFPHIKADKYQFHMDAEAQDQGFEGLYTSARDTVDHTLMLRDRGLLGPGEWLDSDTITLVASDLNAAGLDVTTQAHETEHLINEKRGVPHDELAHLEVYARVANNARTKSERDAAVYSMRAWLYRKGRDSSVEAAEEYLDALIQIFELKEE